MAAYSKLNTNQIKFRGEKIKPYVADVTAFCLKPILEEAGVWDRLAREWLLPGKTIPVDDATNDQLYEAAIRGGLENRDPRIMQMYDDRRQSKANEDTWAAKFEIVPYRVADASLEQIVLEGDEWAIKKVMEALIERSSQDGCDEGLCQRVAAVVEEWLAWAETGLKVHRREDEYVFEDTPSGEKSSNDRVPAVVGG